MRTSDKTDEITAARSLLERLNQRLDLSGKVVVLDALNPAGLNLLDSPLNLTFPGGLRLRVAGVQVFAQKLHQLANAP